MVLVVLAVAILFRCLDKDSKMAKVLISYRGIPQSPGWATGDLVADAFRRNGHEVDTYGNFYKQGPSSRIPGSLTIEEVRRKQFDLALYMEMNDDDSQYLELKYIPAKVRAYWDFDVSYHPDFTASVCNYLKFDHIFCANPDFRSFFEKFAPRASILPYGFCCMKHTPNAFKSFRERKYQFAIIGSPWKERKEIVTALKDEGMDAHLITGVFREEYIQTLADTKVSINYNVQAGAGLLVMRVWESLATHSCLITNAGDHISRFLTVGDDCLVYNDIPGLVELCKKINKEPDIARRMARQGYITGQKNHSYDSRITEILETLRLSNA